MAIRKILRFPHPVLESKCSPVDTEAALHEIKVVRKVVNSLLATANHHYGMCLGLSANQIGYDMRIFAMRTAGGPFFAVINPKIIARIGGVKRLNERCMSRVDADGNMLPGISVRRAKHIKVEAWTLQWSGYNVDGEKPHFVPGPCYRKETFELKGIDARVFQHEIDHLNGVVI